MLLEYSRAAAMVSSPRSESTQPLLAEPEESNNILAFLLSSLFALQSPLLSLQLQYTYPSVES